MNMHTAIAPASRIAIQATGQPDRTAWDRAMSAYLAAQKASDRYDAKVLRPISERLDRVAPDSLSFEMPRADGEIARYNMWPSQLHNWDDHSLPAVRQKAAEVREAWLKRQAAADQWGWDAVNEESERLIKVMCDRVDDLIEMPSPDRSALMWKLDYLFGPTARDEEDCGDAWCAEWINAVMADARRFLSA